MAQTPRRKEDSRKRRPLDGSQAIEVAAGLLFRAGQLLIAQRHRGDHLGGLWEFPGGKRESGETFQECLRRELQEELGIDVEPHELLHSLTHPYPEKVVHIQFYRCTCPTGVPRPIDCQAVAWVNREGLDGYTFPPADRELLDLVKSRADLWDPSPEA